MPKPIAVQLYSLREQAERDLPAVLERLARIGYLGVECAGLHGRTPAELRRLVSEAGLELVSAHAMAVGAGATAALDAAAELGVSTAVVPVAGPERFGDGKAVRALARELNHSAELAAERGLRLGYHNHFWEWSRLEDGTPAYDLLAEELAPTVILELDVYWATVAGQEPAAVIARHADRVRLLHLKDGPAHGPEEAMTAAGDGAVDLRAAAAAGDAVEWHIVELDRCDSDMLAAIERSYTFLTGEGISSGREA